MGQTDAGRYHLIAKGMVDRKRAIMGGSYGGYVCKPGLTFARSRQLVDIVGRGIIYTHGQHSSIWESGNCAEDEHRRRKKMIGPARN
jgi:hypothetical protein